MADNAKFVIDFTANVKELKKAIQDLQAFSKGFKKEAEKSRTAETRHNKKIKDTLKDEGSMSKSLAKQKAKDMEAMCKALKKCLDMESKATKTTRRERKKALDDENKKLNETIKKTGVKAGIAGGLVAGGIGLLTNIFSAGFDFIKGSMEATFQKYQEFAMTRVRALGTVAPQTIEDITALKSPQMKAAAGLGFGPTETAGMIPTMARATGVGGPTEMQKSMRAFGMDAGEVAGIFKTLKQAGESFQGISAAGAMGTRTDTSAGQRQLEKLFAAGLASGLEEGRVPELLEGLQSILQEQNAITSRAVNPSNLAQLAVTLGRTGQPGFQGGRGAAMLGNMQRAILQPGGGEAGMTFMRQAMGFGKPGGNTGFFEAEKAREQGLTPENFNKVMKEVGAQFGLGKEGALAMREMGLSPSLQAAEDLMKAYKDGNKSSEEIKKILDEAEPVDKKNERNTAGILEQAVVTADMERRAVEMGKEIAPMINTIQETIIDVRDFLANAIIPALDKMTGGELTRRQKAADEALLSTPFDPTGKTASEIKRETSRRRMALMGIEENTKKELADVQGKLRFSRADVLGIDPNTARREELQGQLSRVQQQQQLTNMIGSQGSRLKAGQKYEEVYGDPQQQAAKAVKEMSDKVVAGLEKLGGLGIVKLLINTSDDAGSRPAAPGMPNKPNQNAPRK